MVESTLEKAMAPHSSTVAWKIPWTEEPGRPQSVGSWRVGHNWATSLSLFTFMHWKRKWQPIPVFLPGESQGQRTWWAAVYWVTQSQTRLKQLSSSSNREYPLQNSRRENSMNCIAHRLASSQTWLSDFHRELLKTNATMLQYYSYYNTLTNQINMYSLNLHNCSVQFSSVVQSC